MKFLIDENIPYAEAFFESVLTQLDPSGLSKIVRFAGRELTPDDLIDADVLLVRSITKVNEPLLSKANQLKFVGTATIGEDHIDKALLAERGIQFSSAPGCNANSVAEFVISALLVVAEQQMASLADKTVSIIGVGNIGSALLSKLQALNMQVLLCDPFKESDEQGLSYVSLPEALSQGDIVTFHTPLTVDGPHPTHHLLADHNIDLLKDDVCLINASRGEVIDNDALLRHINDRIKDGRPAIHLVLDVWESEPNVLMPLIPFTLLSSAHIAGYSLEGKGRGTEMLYHRVCALFDLAPVIKLEELMPNAAVSQVTLTPSSREDVLELKGTGLLKQLIHLVFDVRRDNALFLNHIDKEGFDWIRKSYPIRREWSSLLVDGCTQQQAQQLANLGFKTQVTR